MIIQLITPQGIITKVIDSKQKLSKFRAEIARTYPALRGYSTRKISKVGGFSELYYFTAEDNDKTFEELGLTDSNIKLFAHRQLPPSQQPNDEKHPVTPPVSRGTVPHPPRNTSNDSRAYYAALEGHHASAEALIQLGAQIECVAMGAAARGDQNYLDTLIDRYAHTENPISILKVFLCALTRNHQVLAESLYSRARDPNSLVRTVATIALALVSDEAILSELNSTKTARYRNALAKELAFILPFSEPQEDETFPARPALAKEILVRNQIMAQYDVTFHQAGLIKKYWKELRNVYLCEKRLNDDMSEILLTQSIPLPINDIIPLYRKYNVIQDMIRLDARFYPRCSSFADNTSAKKAYYNAVLARTKHESKENGLHQFIYKFCSQSKAAKYQNSFFDKSPNISNLLFQMKVVEDLEAAASNHAMESNK